METLLRALGFASCLALTACLLPEVSAKQPSEPRADADAEPPARSPRKPRAQAADAGEDIASSMKAQMRAQDAGRAQEATPEAAAASGSSGASNSGGAGAPAPDASAPQVDAGATGISADHSFANWLVADTVPGAKATPSLKAEGSSVRDTVTGLLWQRGSTRSYPGCKGEEMKPQNSCTWAEAHKYCESLTVDGTGWRLPTKIELESIVDLTRSAPALNTSLFNPPATNALVWSASSDALDADNSAWVLDLSDGACRPLRKTAFVDVLCVK